jgi:elongation factor P
MADTSDFRNGLCIEFKNDLYVIVQFQHVKPGKGGAFVRTKLKNLNTGKVIDNTFTAGEKVTVARVERRPYQYLYKDDTGYHVMHNETYEQIVLQEKMINAPEFMKEGQEVEVIYHADTETPLACELPAHVVLEVTYTEPGVKGDTASGNTTKPATLETGNSVNVPLFINTGEKIKVDTRDKTYVERVK